MYLWCQPRRISEQLDSQHEQGEKRAASVLLRVGACATVTRDCVIQPLGAMTSEHNLGCGGDKAVTVGGVAAGGDRQDTHTPAMGGIRPCIIPKGKGEGALDEGTSATWSISMRSLGDAEERLAGEMASSCRSDQGRQRSGYWGLKVDSGLRPSWGQPIEEGERSSCIIGTSTKD